MIPITHKLTLALLASIVLMVAGNAQAQLVLFFQQEAADVTITASGSVDLNGLSFSEDFGGPSSDILNDTNSGHVWSDLSPGDDIYLLPESHFLFSNLFAEAPGNATGDAFGFTTANSDVPLFGQMAGDAHLYFEDGFAGGTVDGKLTIPGTALVSLGLNEGILTWGPNADQRLIITTIPEPTSLALLGLGGFMILTRRRVGDRPL